MKKRYTTFFLMACLFVLHSALSEAAFFRPDIRPGYGVTKQAWLSDYFAPLRETNMDTPVFILDSGKPGLTALAIGGTHAREIAGYTAATIMVETVRMARGRLIVIPHANNSAISIQDQESRLPRFHKIESRSGTRLLPYGDRRTDIRDQGIPDPSEYVHPSGQVIKDGRESRNLNRVYPGKPDGTPTERLAHAIIELIRAESVDFSVDFHEANTPEYFVNKKGEIEKGGRLAYMLVCNPKGVEVGAMAVLQMSEETGISMKLEQSDRAFRGLSHLEIGDATHCVSFLTESPNPGQDAWRESPDVLHDSTYSLEHRVAMTLSMFRNIAEAFSVFHDNEFEMVDLPAFSDIIEKGVGAYLN
jgi:hypothetical protein